MTLTHLISAIRYHLVSVILTLVLVIAFASLLHVSVPLALMVWLAAAVVSCELWYAVEPFALRWLCGLRVPSRDERVRLDSTLARSSLRVLIGERPDLVAFRGVRCLVITRDLLDVLEDRALSGLLTQTAEPSNWTNLVGFVFVWLGNIPMLCAWMFTRFLVHLARLLGVLVGTSLVVPMVICRDGFLVWFGRFFGAVIVGLFAGTLLCGGIAASGYCLLLAWAVVPGVGALLACESCRLERAADDATIAAGHGPQLLEAVECLLLAEPLPRPAGLLGLFKLPASPLVDRADRLRRALLASPIDL